MTRGRLRRVLPRLLLRLCLASGALLVLLPLYVLLATALKPLDEVIGGSLLAPPREPTLGPLREAWSSACIGTRCEGLRGGLATSLAIALPAACLSTLLGAVNGYALTQWRLPGAHLAFALLLAANLLPYQLVLLPVAVMLRAGGLFGTVEGLILVHVAYGMPYVTLLLRNAFLALPAEIVRAARLDGAGFWSLFAHVVLPIGAPMLAVAFLLQFSAIWNDYLFGLVFGGRATPATVMLNNLVNGQSAGKQRNVEMAGVLLTAVPPLLLYLVAGRWFLRGLAAGGGR